jgi:hypothetical protein
VEAEAPLETRKPRAPRRAAGADGVLEGLRVVWTLRVYFLSTKAKARG